MTSDDVRVWERGHRSIQEPERPWELMQLGNCGSPLETEAGWLVITHGVGPVPPLHARRAAARPRRPDPGHRPSEGAAAEPRGRRARGIRAERRLLVREHDPRRPPRAARTATPTSGRASPPSRSPTCSSRLTVVTGAAIAIVGRRRTGACCIVEISASVDSAPWLRFGPFGVSPSNPPPVVGIPHHRTAVVAPGEPFDRERRPRRSHSASPVTACARAQASAIAATSIGCWSNAGGRSSGPAPPTGVGDRCPSTVSRSSSQRRRRNPSSSTSGRPSRSPPAISTSASAALAYDSRGSGHGHGRRSEQRPMHHDRIGQQRPCPAVAGFDSQDLGGAERGERHRPSVRRSLCDAVVEVRRARSIASSRRGRDAPLCRTPTRCDPSSPRHRGGRASGRRRHGGCACRPVTPCASRRGTAWRVRPSSSSAWPMSGSRTTAISRRATSSVQ